MNSPVSFETLVPMLDEHNFGVLATSGSEYPYTSLITIAFSDDHQYLLFPTLRQTRKYANMVRDTHVSVLLDNRSSTDRNSDALYAMSVLGTAREVENQLYSICKDRFLLRHPHLTDFVSLPQTALIQVTFKKIVLVEKFEIIREFEILQ